MSIVASKAATSTKKRIAAHDERAALPFEERRKGRIYLHFHNCRERRRQIVL